MNIIAKLQGDLMLAARQSYDGDLLPDNISIEVPKQTQHGDLSTNIAMLLAPKLKTSPRQIADKLKIAMEKIPYISSIDVAGAGFINITIKPDAWQAELKKMLSDDYFAIQPIDENKKINIEFVSANPTGPMHVGHGRCAVFGDVLASILEETGQDVTREYYINDAGGQIKILTDSLLLRYKEVITGQKQPIPENLYPGEYLIDAARSLADHHGKNLMDLPEAEREKIARDFAISSMMDLIKNDLSELSIRHDIFFSERALHEQKKIDQVVEALKKRALVYTGTIEPPKGQVQEDWQAREQLLFKATKFGDDQDRPLQRADGSWSYFAGDLAYTQDKIDRGFDKIIFVLGADHIGYIKRIKAITSALSDGKVECDVKICQLVNLFQDGRQLKMSKRAGTFCSVKDVLEQVDAGVMRFIMLTRRSEAAIDFDLKIASQYSKDNPVFYVQYGHVRAKSVIASAAQNMPDAWQIFEKGDYDLSLLSLKEEMEMIKAISLWHKMMQSAAAKSEPHRIAFYLIDLAARFHGLWNLSSAGMPYRFIAEGEPGLTAARLALASAVQKIIARALGVMGVEPLQRM